MERIIFHIDVNSAYLSWSAARYLSLGGKLDYRTIPSVVGGDEERRHGIVLAKSIPAKNYGIMTGESLFSAREKCPNLTIIPPDYNLFMSSSDALMALLREYSPKTQRYSVDESFVDMSHHAHDFREVAKEISYRAHYELGFTVNIGISENKLLAKMASDFEKPNKIHELFKSDLPKKFWPLPIGDLFFVGRKTEAKLLSRGIRTIGDLARLDRKYIENWLKKPGVKIWEYANGIETSELSEASQVKSIGNSTTTSFDVESLEDAKKILLGISEMIGMRLREANLRGLVIAVSIKNKEFTYYSKQKKLDAYTSNTNTIYYESIELFQNLWKGEPIRLFSIRMSELMDNYALQISMFQKYDEADERLDNAIDSIREKYGNSSIHRACFLNTKIDPVIGGVVEEVQYPMMGSEL